VTPVREKGKTMGEGERHFESFCANRHQASRPYKGKKEAKGGEAMSGYEGSKRVGEVKQKESDFTCLLHWQTTPDLKAFNLFS